jgi:uncharacterized protein (TIGR00299 family) protein
LSRDPHPHRRFSDIKNLIRAGNLSPSVKEKSIAIFETIAVEEGKIHGCSPEEVHFHEVGAVDSIVDIVGSVLGMEFLGIGTACASSLPLGSGFVETAHGRIPLPAPATVALLKGIPVHDSGLKEELVTPTGAALVKSLARSFGCLPAMVIEKVGYGVGSRNLTDRPNLLRILIGQEQGAANEETIVILESNLDDTNPEWLGFLMERLFEAGALDVVFSPGYMKKKPARCPRPCCGKASAKGSAHGSSLLGKHHAGRAISLQPEKDPGESFSRDRQSMGQDEGEKSYPTRWVFPTPARVRGVQTNCKRKRPSLERHLWLGNGTRRSV